MHFSSISQIAFLCLFYLAIQTDAMSRAPPRRKGRITNMTDTRAEGISYEINRHRSAQYFRCNYQGKSLKDFLTAGPHHIRVDYGSRRFAEQQNSFLSQLIDSEIDDMSLWRIDVVGDIIPMKTNFTLLSIVLEHLPTIAETHWEASKFIPQFIIDTLHSHHPSSRLYYTFPWNEFARRWQRRSYARSNKPSNNELLPDWWIAQRERDEIDIFKPILGSPVLYSLKAESGGDMHTSSIVTEMVGSMLKTCSNLRELDFTIDSWGSSLINGPVAFDFTDLNITLPPLEVLKLYNYDFTAQPNGLKWKALDAEKPSSPKMTFPWNQLPYSFVAWFEYPLAQSIGRLGDHRTPPDLGLHKDNRTNLDVWLDIMDWTKLHTLKLEHFNLDIIPKFQGPVLPGLKNLELWFGRSSCSFESSLYLNFILESAPLESLTLTGIHLDSISPMESIIAILGQRHPNLHTLRLTVHKSSPAKSDASLTLPAPSPFLNTSLLQRLYSSCPDIHTLDINVDMEKKWDYDLLDYLASIPNLQHLTLRFEEPYVSRGERRYEYEYHYDKNQQEENEKERVLMQGLTLYLRKKKGGKPFETLVVFVGDREVVSAGGKGEAPCDDGGEDDWQYIGPDEYDVYEYEEEESLAALQREL